MSPVVPSDPDLISQNKTNLAEVDKQAGTVTIPEIMDWRWRMAEQQSWFIENPFSSLRVFFCTGEVDTEVLAKERAHLTQFQAADPSRVFFTDYPSLGHDLALPNRKTNGQRHKLLLDLHCFLHGFLPALPQMRLAEVSTALLITLRGRRKPWHHRSRSKWRERRHCKQVLCTSEVCRINHADKIAIILPWLQLKELNCVGLCSGQIGGIGAPRPAPIRYRSVCLYDSKARTL